MRNALECQNLRKLQLIDLKSRNWARQQLYKNVTIQTVHQLVSLMKANATHYTSDWSKNHLPTSLFLKTPFNLVKMMTFDNDYCFPSSMVHHVLKQCSNLTEVNLINSRWLDVGAFTGLRSEYPLPLPVYVLRICSLPFETNRVIRSCSLNVASYSRLDLETLRMTQVDFGRPESRIPEDAYKFPSLRLLELDSLAVQPTGRDRSLAAFTAMFQRSALPKLTSLAIHNSHLIPPAPLASVVVYAPITDQIRSLSFDTAYPNHQTLFPNLELLNLVINPQVTAKIQDFYPFEEKDFLHLPRGATMLRIMISEKSSCARDGFYFSQYFWESLRTLVVNVNRRRTKFAGQLDLICLPVENEQALKEDDWKVRNQVIDLLKGLRIRVVWKKCHWKEWDVLLPG